MSTSKLLGGIAALAISSMSATAGFAEVTPKQVWDDWSGYMESFGYELSATEADQGGNLTVSDIAMTIQIPEEDATMTLSMGDLTFSDNGDGTVSVIVPANMPVTISGVGPDGRPQRLAQAVDRGGAGGDEAGDGNPLRGLARGGTVI